MMKIKLQELASEEQNFNWDVPTNWITQVLEENAVEDELEAGLFAEDGALQLDVWVHRSEQDVFFRSELSGLLKATCVRCLESISWPIEIEMSGVYCPHSRHGTDEPDDPSHYFYSNDEIDFAGSVREHLFLNLPLNPSCELAGFGCENGALQENYNLAEGFEDEEEEAETPKIDKRWEALLKIKESMEKKK